MSRAAIISLSLIGALAVLGAVVLWFKTPASWNVLPTLAGTSTRQAPDAGWSDKDPRGGISAGSRTRKTYTDPDYGFSFDYPDDLTIGKVPGEKGIAIIVQKTVSGLSTTGFQVSITPFDEPDQVLTSDRIHRDIPDLTVGEPQEAVIGQNLHVLIFWGDDPGLGKTREVWMVRGGNLYQITAPAAFDKELAGILQTWRFD